MWDLTVDTFNSKPEECLKYVKDNWSKIPILNFGNPSNLKNGQLVRYYGMIQNIPNPVYYYSQYEVLNQITGVKDIRSGKYRDSLSCKDNETLICESDNCINQEKYLYYCVSVPALNQWTYLKYVDENSVQSLNTLKRHFEEMDVEVKHSDNCNKRLCTSLDVQQQKPAVENSQNSEEHNPHIAKGSCIVNVYDVSHCNLKVNNIIEICGFIYFNTSTAALGEQSLLSEIPSLHAVSSNVVNTINPFNFEMNLKSDMILCEAKRLRTELEIVLTQLLLGDMLAVEYLICHLIAHVYARIDCTVLGKFTINISNVPVNNDYIKFFYKILSQLLPKTKYLPMSLQQMNSSKFLPKKNYDNDQLETGLLQLSDHTHLIIDETKLEVGKLEENGVQNIKALKCLIEYQKLDYDFKYYTVEFLADIPVLILSEGKSLLPSDCHLTLNPCAEYLSSLDEGYLATDKYLQEPLLNKLRDYLEVITSINEFTLPDHLLQVIENDLVDQRQAGEKSSADDYHFRLVLARLLSLSYGEKELTKNIWDKTFTLENTRKSRFNVN